MTMELGDTVCMGGHDRQRMHAELLCELLWASCGGNGPHCATGALQQSEGGTAAAGTGQAVPQPFSSSCGAQPTPARLTLNLCYSASCKLAASLVQAFGRTRRSSARSHPPQP